MKDMNSFIATMRMKEVSALKMFKLDSRWRLVLIFFLITMLCCELYSLATPHGETCSETSTCQYGMDCLADINNETRCLCTPNFYNNDSGNCVPVKNLIMYYHHEETSTTITYKLYFVDKSDVEFITNISKISEKDRVLITKASENQGVVNITGLQSNTVYFLNHTAFAKNSTYYKKRLLDFFYTLITTVSTYTDTCSIQPGCDTGSECLRDKNNISRCLCIETKYRTVNNSCESLSKLKVSNVSSDSTATSITIYWSKPTSATSSLEYLISFNTDKAIYVTGTDVTINNLRSGQEYEFHIYVYIPPDYFSDSKTGAMYTYKASTVSQYGVACSSDQYCENGFHCRPTLSGARCLCSIDHHRTDSGQCISNENLKVTDVTIARMTSSITFYWFSTTVSERSAQFTISRGPYDAWPASATGGTLTNLPFGTHFTFSITVSLKDDYVNEHGPIYYLNASTMSVYGQVCNTAEDCEGGTHCLGKVNDTLRCRCNDNEYRSATDQCESNVADDIYKVIVIVVACVLGVVVASGVVAYVVKRKREKRRKAKESPTNNYNSVQRNIDFEESDDYDYLKADIVARSTTPVASNIYSICHNENAGHELDPYIRPIDRETNATSGYYTRTIEENAQDHKTSPKIPRGLVNQNEDQPIPEIQVQPETETDLTAFQIIV